MAGIEVDEALVLPHVVEPVRDDHTGSGTAEIVVIDLDGFVGVSLAFAIEIAQ